MEKIKITEQIAASIADMFLIPFLKSLKKREDGTYYSKELNRTYRVNDGSMLANTQLVMLLLQLLHLMLLKDSLRLML